MKLVVVICHFKEKLDWITQLKHPYVIYNKNPENNHKFEINLPNVGFDTVAYLTYIIDNYDNLPDFVCFSQDDPFFHCKSFVNRVNDFNFNVEFLPLGITYVRDNKSILDQTINYAKNTGISYTEPIKFINSAQCIVSKTLIQKNPVEFYERVRDTLPKKEKINQINYYVEYLWPTILNFNDKLKVSYNNC